MKTGTAYNHRTLLFLLVSSVLLTCCRQASVDVSFRDSATLPADTLAECAADTARGIPAVSRRPDICVHISTGEALALQTDGLTLKAVGTAVRHGGAYSVTSLREEEMPPLPQGMVNMTAKADGYRLLPGGEHFLPYAELRVAYDPDRLPDGYTPEDIYTSYYDSATLAWLRLERVGVDTVNHEVVSVTSHFTDFVNELLKAPEMPETQAFVPTAMGSLEAVNPMDGLPMILPPEANNEGTANLSYPIWTPAGRGGMQPVLTLTYSSAGGNGWLGVGWDIGVPSVTVDTRWGVPRYNAAKETEIYLLHGEQLVTHDEQGNLNPMPHRTNLQQDRMTGPDGVRFHARTGDAHDSIIRHGDMPYNYWWEVVDRTGTTHYYGHYPEEGMDVLNISTLSDYNGNIAKWMLCESRDVYGNWVRYFYDTVMTGGSNPGRQIYLDSISYTGNGSESGSYSVVFKRKQRGIDDRPVSCIYGFKEETDQVLCHIIVKSGDDAVTGYYFETEEGYASNFKTRLKSVSKVDRMSTQVNLIYVLKKMCEDIGYGYQSNVGVTRQIFDYYDAPATDTLFGAEVHSAVPRDSVKGFLLKSFFRKDSVVSTTALGVSHSAGWSVGGTLSLGTGKDVWNSDYSIGGNYHRSGRSSESLTTLVDLDGDGLADKVFVKNGRIYWRRQLLSPGNQITFGDTQTVAGVSHFLVESGISNTFGVQVSVPLASGSGSWDNTVSTTSTYFADVDGDGLVDIVDNGQVYFNRTVDGRPTFAKYTAPEGNDPEPALTTSADCGGIIFDGTINDSVACRLVWEAFEISPVQDSAFAFPYCATYEAEENTIVRPVRYPDGYRIVHFRLVYDCSHRNLVMSGVPETESVRVWVAPESGLATLRCSVRLVEDHGAERTGSRHVDGVTYTIQHSRDVTPMGDTLHSVKDTILMSRYICRDCYRTESFDTMHYDSTYVFRVNQGDILFFRLQSNDDKQFDNVEDLIKIELGSRTYTNGRGFVLSDDRVFQAPYKGRYIVDGTYTNTSPGTFTAEIKGGTTHVMSHVISASGVINKDSVIAITISSSDPNPRWDKVECRARIRYWSDSLPDTVTIWTPGKKVVVHTSGSVWGNTTYQCLFGHLYDGWGQFAYHPVGMNGTIRPGSLVPPAGNIAASTGDTTGLRARINTEIDTSEFNQPSLDAFVGTFGKLYSPVSDSSCWVGMTADAEHGRWVSFGMQNSVGRVAMSNSVQYGWYSSVQAVAADSSVALPPTVVYDDAVPAPEGDTPAKGIRKVNRSHTNTYSIGALSSEGELHHGLSYHHGLSFNHGGSSIEMDYLDLNGDRYPDIVGIGYVQYRSQWGGMGTLSPLQIVTSNVSASVYGSVGYSFGASGQTQIRAISSDPADAEFINLGDGSAGGAFSFGLDQATWAWSDVNGDGLPDHISEYGTVCINTGYNFLPDENWHIQTPHSGQSVSAAVNLGASLKRKYNIVQGSIQMGAGLSRSHNRSNQVLMDINGDGLPDKVWRSLITTDVASWYNILNPTTYVNVSFNLGGGRWSGNYQMNINNFNCSETYNESLDAGLTLGVTFLGAFKLTGGINASPYSGSVNRDRMQLVDVNGDGLPDLVTSDNEGSLTVRYNKAGRTNLLRQVTNSTGSRIHMEYTLSEPSLEQPSRSWQLTAVTTKDPLNPNGSDTTVTLFSYSNPHYDRYERMFYGYGSVETSQTNPSDGSVYRTVRRDFHNTNILNRGRIRRELISAGNGDRYIERVHQYTYVSRTGGTVDTCSGDAFCSCDRVVTRFYEGNTTPRLTTAERFKYDCYHNVTGYYDEGDTAYAGDGLYATLSYRTGMPHNLVGLCSEYMVFPSGGGVWMRKTENRYDNATGRLTRRIMYNGTGMSIYDFVYDAVYGNLITATLPDNDSLLRLSYSYTYDNTLHTYPVKIKDSYKDSVMMTYDLLFGKPVSVTDPGGGSMEYAYDLTGRLVSVTSPLNNSIMPSVVNEYYPINYDNSNNTSIRPYAVTRHYDDAGILVTETAVITDGFGRVIQTKRGITSGGQQKIQVSGRALTDAFGRIVMQYDPTVDPANAAIGDFNAGFAAATPTTTAYDILDRTVSVTQPLGYVTSLSYGVQEDENGIRRFTTTVTDPNNHVTVQYADHDGRRVQTTDADGGITLLAYDALGQLVSATDPEGFTTAYTYDRLGRLTSRVHPDAGATQYTYDPAGNLRTETNPLGEIFYYYRYQRLVKKRYGNIMGNNVTYTYGTSGTGRGRIVHVSDGTGEREMAYDQLGNVVREERTVAVPGLGNVHNFTTLYEYDSWGRMLSMTYPDGETVTYTYLYGGDLFSMRGIKGNATYSYVDRIEYNDFGQRSHMEYGNGTTTNYQYDAMHRLSSLTSVSASGTMQQIQYTLDGVGNIGTVQNTAAAVAGLGGTYTVQHSYDALDRLVNSSCVGSVASYTQNFTYSSSGRLDSKETVAGESGSLCYAYCDNFQPHAPRRILEQNNMTLYDLMWDAAGNLGQVNMAHGTDCLDSRFLFWTEDSRLHTVADSRFYSYYAYDHAGERTLKLTGKNSVLDVNAETMLTASVLSDITMYPSPFIVLTNKGYTKHYYMGSERVCARIGGGGLEPSEYNDFLSGKASQLLLSCINEVSDRELFKNPLNCIQAVECDNDEINQSISGIPQSLEATVTVNMYEFEEMMDSYSTNSPLQAENDVFFYHSDHLGGANWITDASGYPVQHLQYMPFGETLVDQQAAGYQERFTFTGKEKDVETGYGYFGARYMDHELMTMWLSVDPMSDKYPSISPYAYCAWNPVKLVDPNGEFGVPMHKRMARKALRKHSSLGNSQQRQIVKATGWYSDINQGDMPIHFDNHNPNSPFDKGVENIKSVFESAIENYGDNIKNGDYREAGVNLHTIADFYSHSNYVEICQEYFGDAIKSVTDIPLYSEVYENREKYAGLIEILETELKTGVYNYDNVFEDKFTHDGNSHRYMNHDSPRSRMGKRRFNGIKGFDYAYSLAEREIIKTVSRKKEGQ